MANKKALFIIFILITIISSCSPRKSGPTVVIYTSVDQVYSEPILKEFEAKTGIQVLAVYDVEATKTVGLVNRLIAEERRPQADVFWNGEFVHTLLLKEEGILDVYHSPSARDIPEHYLDPEGYWSGFGGRVRVLLVNTDLVSEDEYPRSILDLLDPKWPADKVGMSTPLFGTALTHAASLYAWWGDYEAKELYKKLKSRRIRVVDGNSVVKDLVVSGQLMFGLTDSDDACSAIKRNAPVKMLLPDQDNALGTLVFPNTVSLIKNSPHPKEAKMLIDFLLSPQVERNLILSGYCQMSLRSLGLNSQECFPFSAVKPIPTRFEEAFNKLKQAQSELKEIFLD